MINYLSSSVVIPFVIISFLNCLLVWKNSRHKFYQNFPEYLYSQGNSSLRPQHLIVMGKKITRVLGNTSCILRRTE